MLHTYILIYHHSFFNIVESSFANTVLRVAHSGLSRTSGFCTRGEDGFPGPDGGAGWDNWDGWDRGFVEMKCTSTSRSETGGFEGLSGGVFSGGDGGVSRAVGTDATFETKDSCGVSDDAACCGSPGAGDSAGGTSLEAAGFAR